MFIDFIQFILVDKYFGPSVNVLMGRGKMCLDIANF